MMGAQTIWIDAETARGELRAAASAHVAARRRRDRVMRTLMVVAGVVVVAILFAVLGYVVVQGASHVNATFFTKLPAPVGVPGGGMANALVGSAIMNGIALLIAVPVGVGAAIYLSEYATGAWGQAIRFATDILNGTPSIVTGVFVFTIMVLPMHTYSALAGGLALGIVMIPVVVRTGEEMLHMVPQALRSAGLALGASRWRISVDIVLRTALPGVLTGIMLGLSRIVGETAPLIFTALNNRYWSTTLLEPMASVPIFIYRYALSPYRDWQDQAWAAAFVLIFTVLLLNILTRWLVRGPRGAGTR